MVVPIGYEDSGIPLLKGLMLAPAISICGLPLSEYLSFTLLVNSAWLNIFNVVVSDQILHLLVCLVVFLNSLREVLNGPNHIFCGRLIYWGFFPRPFIGLLFPDHEVGLGMGNESSEMSSNISGLNKGLKCILLVLR